MRDLVERAVSAVALVVVAPVLAAIALAVVVTSGAPVLFRQERVGLHGRPFVMLKFRTMVRNAIQVGQELELTEDPFGIVENDPRITRVGRFLRRTSLDELPQLVNVVRGEMRLVGPRPDVPAQVAHYTDEDRRRLEVKPGITGWAQVNGRDDLPWSERFLLDAWYVDHRSVLLDGRILWRTVGQVGRPDPATSDDEVNIERLRAARG